MVKHGSASLSVIAAAVALPLTNMSFSAKWLMGRDYEPFDYANLVWTGRGERGQRAQVRFRFAGTESMLILAVHMLAVSF